jgi:hypothetical protein
LGSLQRQGAEMLHQRLPDGRKVGGEHRLLTGVDAEGLVFAQHVSEQPILFAGSGWRLVQHRTA